MSDVFTALANALGQFLGQSASTSCIANQDCGGAGFVLGIVTIITITIAVVWAIGEHVSGSAIFLPIGIGIVFVTLVGWWPIWSLIFIALIAVLIYTKPFGSTQEGI